MVRLSRSAFSIYAITLATFAVFAVAAIPVAGAVLRAGHGFLPGGQALAWDGPLVVLHVSADLQIGVPYVVISLARVRLARLSRGTIRLVWAFVAFGLVIVACGMTHMASALTVWEPMWWVAGGITCVTAVSVAMAVAAPLLPHVLETARNARETERNRIVPKRAHRETAASKARFRHLLEVAPDGILAIDAEGRIALRSGRAGHAAARLTADAAALGLGGTAIHLRSRVRV